MSEAQMMKAAGEAAFSYLTTQWPGARRLVVFCGSGNNAGDAYILAALAARAGWQVTCCYVSALSEIRPGPSATALADCQSLPITWQPFESLGSDLPADVYVDALLGIGLSGEVREPYSACIQWLNQADVPVLSLDCPSGLNVDTGTEMGQAVKASATITFIAEKLGLYTHQGSHCCGKIALADLGLPALLNDWPEPVAELMSDADLTTFLPRRPRHAHKGHNGHVCVIGGDYGMGGAVRMAAEAALRSGAGLVTVATRPEHVTVVNATRPEIMCHEVNKPEDLRALLARANAIVLGPGLGQGEWAQMLFDEVMLHAQPKVMDADSLNLLSKVPCRRADWILTPHPGEASRLLDCECRDIQQDRLKHVIALQHAYGGTAILKGAGTLIQSEASLTEVCPAGNPGMATAGMGDILSGVIGGLLAQGLALDVAAKVGVWVHAKAADCAAREGGERGLLATDLLAHLREMVNPQ
jgi:NAD(P)H-hydrate epimerase